MSWWVRSWEATQNMDEKPVASCEVLQAMRCWPPLSEVKVQGVTLSVLPIFEKATVEEILIAGRLIRGVGGRREGKWVR